MLLALPASVVVRASPSSWKSAEEEKEKTANNSCLEFLPINVRYGLPIKTLKAFHTYFDQQFSNHAVRMFFLEL